MQGLQPRAQKKVVPKTSYISCLPGCGYNTSASQYIFCSPPGYFLGPNKTLNKVLVSVLSIQANAELKVSLRPDTMT